MVLTQAYPMRAMGLVTNRRRQPRCDVLRWPAGYAASGYATGAASAVAAQAGVTVERFGPGTLLPLAPSCCFTDRTD
jgi:hypothetical protein